MVRGRAERHEGVDKLPGGYPTEESVEGEAVRRIMHWHCRELLEGDVRAGGGGHPSGAKKGARVRQNHEDLGKGGEVLMIVSLILEEGPEDLKDLKDRSTSNARWLRLRDCTEGMLDG